MAKSKNNPSKETSEHVPEETIKDEVVVEDPSAVEDAEILDDGMSEEDLADLEALDGLDEGEPNDDGPLETETDIADLEPVEAKLDEVETTEVISEVTPEPERIIEQTTVRKGGFWPLALGGAFVAALGFSAADPEVLPDAIQPFVPAFLKTNATNFDAEFASAESARAELAQKIESIQPFDPSSLSSQIEAVSGSVATLQSDLTASIDGLSRQLSALTDANTAFEARITSLEKRPLAEAVGEEVVAAYERELGALREDVLKQRAEIESVAKSASEQIQATQAAAAAKAEEAALFEQLAASKAALGKIQASIEAGQPFGEAFNELASAAPVDVPAILGQTAADGVQSLAALQAGFPAIARETLASARADGSDGATGGGIAAFFAKQTGARSVTPREGSDVDAVLSRVEAAVRAGNLATALDEVGGLPDTVSAPVSDWRDAVQSRLDVDAAAKSLSSTLNAM